MKETEDTETKIIERLVEVLVPGEKTTETVYVECDSATNKPKPFSSEQSNGRSSSKTQMDSNGKLTTECDCADYKAQIKVKDTEIRKLKQSHTQEQKTIVVTEYKTRWYDIACRWIALAVIGFLIYRSRKLLLPI